MEQVQIIRLDRLQLFFQFHYLGKIKPWEYYRLHVYTHTAKQQHGFDSETSALDKDLCHVEEIQVS